MREVIFNYLHIIKMENSWWRKIVFINPWIKLQYIEENISKISYIVWHFKQVAQSRFNFHYIFFRFTHNFREMRTNVKCMWSISWFMIHRPLRLLLFIINCFMEICQFCSNHTIRCPKRITIVVLESLIWKWNIFHRVYSLEYWKEYYMLQV